VTSDDTESVSFNTQSARCHQTKLIMTELFGSVWDERGLLCLFWLWIKGLYYCVGHITLLLKEDIELFA